MAAEVNIVPYTHADLQRGAFRLSLQAVNSASIPTYDTHSLTLDLGSLCISPWLFIITDVEKAILGSHLLQHIMLLVDFGNGQIMDTLKRSMH